MYCSWGGSCSTGGPGRPYRRLTNKVVISVENKGTDHYQKYLCGYAFLVVDNDAPSKVKFLVLHLD